MTVKVMLFARRRADITREQYKNYYESRHAPLVRRSLPLLRQYSRNYLNCDADTPMPVYDSITEFWFDNMADLNETFQWARSEAGRLVLGSDEAEFMDRSSLMVFLVEECMLPGDTHC